MTSEQCIDIIKNRLIALVNSGQLKAKIKPSKSSISFYVTDIYVGERPLLTLRLSNHNPAYQNYIRSDLTPPSEGYDTNISIEFYKPKYKASGRIARNRVRTKVEVPQDVKGVVPFFVNSYEYEPSILVAADIDQIYNAILSWINGGYNAEYIDPFVNTPKEAKVKSKIANITWNIAQNISVDRNGNYGSANGWGADYVSENNRIKTNRNMNKKPIRLTESDLHTIVEDVVSSMMNGMGLNGQSQQQPRQQYQSQSQQQPQPQQQQRQQQQGQQQQGEQNQQQQTAQMTAYQQALTRFLNKMNQNIVTQFGEINKKLDYIMNGGINRYGGGFRGLNRM